MRDLLPDGEDLRRAVKWVSDNLKDDPEQPVQRLVKEAIFKFNLSPRDSELLMGLYREGKQES